MRGRRHLFQKWLDKDLQRRARNFTVVFSYTSGEKKKCLFSMGGRYSKT